MPLQYAKHEGNLSLVHHFDDVYLHNCLSGEVVRLPKAFNDAVLLFSSGQGFLKRGTESVWAHTFLKKHVVQDGDVFEVLWRCPQTKAVHKEPIASNCCALQKAQVEVLVGCASHKTQFDIIARMRNKHGAFLWWSLPTIYNNLGGPEFKPWYVVRGKSWKAWRKLVLGSDLDDECLQQSSLAKDTDTLCGPQGDFPFASVSTHALILLLVRWSGMHEQNGRLRHVGDAAGELLDSFLAMLPSHFELRATAGDATWRPPYDMVAESYVYFPVSDGMVDLSRAKLCASRAFAAALPDLVDLQSCTLALLLKSAPCISKRNNDKEFGWLPHFIWQLGSFLEPLIIGLDIQELSDSAWWKMPCSLRFHALDLAAHERAPFILGYDRATLSALSPLPAVLGLAVDDSRAGRQAWKLTCILKPEDNQAMWLLPQAGLEKKSCKV